MWKVVSFVFIFYVISYLAEKFWGEVVASIAEYLQNSIFNNLFILKQWENIV